MQTDYLVIHFHSPVMDNIKSTAIHPVSPMCWLYLKKMPGFQHGVLFLEGSAQDLLEQLQGLGFVEAAVFSDTLLNMVDEVDHRESFTV